jgi:hypothetical protein
VNSFASPGIVTLECTDAGAGLVKAEFTRITAVQVDSLSNTQI